MLENKNVVNRVSLFRKIMRLGQLQYVGAYERLPRANKADYLIGSTSSGRGTCIVATQIPSGQLGDDGCRARQCRTGREALIPSKGKVELTKERSFPVSSRGSPKSVAFLGQKITESEEGIVGILDGRDKKSRNVVNRDQQDMTRQDVK